MGITQQCENDDECKCPPNKYFDGVNCVRKCPNGEVYQEQEIGSSKVCGGAGADAGASENYNGDEKVSPACLGCNKNNGAFYLAIAIGLIALVAVV